MRGPTAEEIRTKLRDYGVKFKSNTSKPDLIRLLEDHIASITPETNNPDEHYESDIHREVHRAYNEVVFWRQNLVMVPSGKAGKDFVQEAANILNSFNNNEGNKSYAIMLLMILFPLVLQKPSANSKSRDHTAAIERRLKIFRNGDFDLLLREGRVIQSRLPSKDDKTRNALKSFTRLMLHGKVSQALRAIRDSDIAPVPITPEVVDELVKKHPPSAETSSLLQGPTLPKTNCMFSEISAGAVTKAAKTLSGSGGPSGADSDLWKHILLSKKLNPASSELAQAIATFALKLATEPTDPKHLSAYVASRLVPLSKRPTGIRPIGIGEVLRRLTGKVITQALKPDLIECTAPIQLCAGLEGGVEAAVHAARDLFMLESTECLLLIDASNAFNSLNRIAALNNVDYICPEFKIYLQNTYGLTANLFLCDGENNEVLKSSEGTTQGDTAAMHMYACCLMPLIRSVEDKDSKLTQIFYADDGLGGGTLSTVKTWWDKVKLDGPGYGYLPNPKKSYLIVKPEYEEAAQSIFPDVNITTQGQRYLGSYIGTEEGQAEFVRDEVAKWESEIDQICDIASNEPQLAYTAYTVGLSKRWSYLMRTTPGISDQLGNIEEKIHQKLLPAITGQPVVSETLRSVASLPVRFGGLGMDNPQTTSDSDYSFSKFITEELSLAVLAQQETFKITQKERAEKKSLIYRTKNDIHQKKIEEIKSTMTAAESRNLDLHTEKGASSWLTCLPLQSLNFTLNRQEWYDAMSARYNLPLVGQALPQKCACGEENTIDHLISCKLGGFVCFRHNNVRDLIGHELNKVCIDTKIEPHLLNVRGANLPAGTITADGARLDISSKSFWSDMDSIYFDVRIFNPRITSNSNQSIAKTYEKHEREKKTAYLHRVLEVEKSSFTPLVMSTTGGLGREFNKTLKQLAEKKAKKTGYSYDQCIRYLRLRLSFAMVRSVTISIRGHRGRLRAEGSSGRDDSIYQID